MQYKSIFFGHSLRTTRNFNLKSLRNFKTLRKEILIMNKRYKLKSWVIPTVIAVAYLVIFIFLININIKLNRIINNTDTDSYYFTCING
jgi:hypothetical protein